MDPVSHAVFGQVLATAVSHQTASLRPRVVAGILGALAPDIDAVLMPLGWDVYLHAHEIGTHSLAGSLPVAGAAALVVRAFVRDARLSELLAFAWLGSLSHMALDVLSGARIQIGWPFVSGRTSLPLVAMADPWLLAVLVAGSVALAVSRHRPRPAAIAVVAVMAAFLGVKGLLLATARFPDSSSATGPVLARLVEARWASLTEWNVFDRRADTLTAWRIRVGGAPTLLLSWPLVEETPLVRRSHALRTVQNFLDVHELGFAGERPRTGGGSEVLWSDMRFCWRPGLTGDDAGVDPVLSANSPSGSVRIACGLWFGGAFDRDGRATSQLVKVGQWWQTRPLEP